MMTMLRMKLIRTDNTKRYCILLKVMIVRWRRTEKGKDTLPILMQLVAFVSKWYSDVVFEDKMPRKLTEIFPDPLAREIIMGIR
jgi:hypothetical protein